MVGQMISLNQLDQLISINQTVTGSTGTGTTGLLQPAVDGRQCARFPQRMAAPPILFRLR